MLGPFSLLAASAFSSYHIASTEVSAPTPALERVVYQVQVGASPLNRFAITRVHKRRAHADGSLILLSPFLLPGAFYEISEAGGYAKSAAGRLAESGIDVWLVDQRHTGLPAGACESGAADCSVMLDWNFDTYSDDALYALSLLRAEEPCNKPALGGFSAGANAALATLNRAPREFAGLFLYEGTFFTTDPTIAQHNAAICTDLESKLSHGIAYDASAAVPGLVLQLAQAAPAAPFPIPVFPPGTTNEQAMFYVFGSPPPPGAFAPTPGFVRCITDFSTQSFVYTNEARLKLIGPLFDSYASVAAMRDLACGLGGSDDSHYDRVSEFKGDVLIYVEGTGFGPAMFDTAGLFGPRATVRIDQNAQLGEADAYFHRDWNRVFLAPLRSWLHATL
jgi:pimeloyl-ACP methyl ester carboxylesterase